MKIKWLSSVQQSLKIELLRITEDNNEAARRITLYVRERTEQLAKYRVWATWTNRRSTRTDLSWSSTFLPYRVRATTVELLRFFHKRKILRQSDRTSAHLRVKISGLSPNKPEPTVEALLFWGWGQVAFPLMGRRALGLEPPPAHSEAEDHHRHGRH